MENRNNKGFRAIAVIALVVAVAGISVAFAALAQNLPIYGAGEVRATDWVVRWSGATGNVLTGGPGVSAGTQTATIPGSQLTITGIILEKPGDSVSWVVTAENAGDIDAQLDSFTDLFTKTVTFDPAEESDLTADNVVVTLTQNNSPTFSPVVAGQRLDAGTTQSYLLTVTFEATEVPTENVIIGINALFPWVQAQ